MSRTVNDNIARIAYSKGITLAELARRTKLDRETFYREPKRGIGIYIAAKIADALYCTLDDLMDGVDFDGREG